MQSVEELFHINKDMAIWNKETQTLNANNNRQYEVVMLADKDGNILNTSGSASNIPIASGEVSGYSHINKFGYVSNISSNPTIWDGGTLYSFATSAGAVTATSDDNDDNGLILEIQGLDSDYNLVTQDLTLGNTAATNLLRIFRVKVKTPATGETTNVGDISVNIAGSLKAKILAGNGQTLMALYTIPAGKTGYLINISFSVDKNTSSIFKIYTHEYTNGSVENLKGQFGTFGTPYFHNYAIPLKFTEKTDVEVRGDSDNTCGGGCVFDIVLVDNN